MTEKTEDIEICADISLKRMYLILLKTQEMILENNPQYKRDIVTLLTSIEHDILMLNNKNNSISRDLFD